MCEHKLPCRTSKKWSSKDARCPTGAVLRRRHSGSRRHQTWMLPPHVLGGNFIAMGRSVTVDPSVQAHAEAAVQARTGAEVRTPQFF